MTSRRSFILGTAAWAATGFTASAQAPQIEVWRDPHCGCCSGWVDYLRTEGFTVEDRVVASVSPVRRMLGTPSDLLSCHAARVAGFVLEGHVPAPAIRRLLSERPAGIVGLAVPATPVGSPGMEVPGHAPETYDVVAWRADGSHRPFMRFTGARPT
ncbi:DUF411 domain-containing protein [Sabulicella rubraurantiaca]|uniref:DUF411 domain-containing protein n=1 Tax=Sabulicella rubraurantiaca TaxID=2811429 RepID=UPI001A95E79E|nr:DUF411 domain-containing protein [Sabulicella rubraurantiaca]